MSQHMGTPYAKAQAEDDEAEVSEASEEGHSLSQKSSQGYQRPLPPQRIKESIQKNCETYYDSTYKQTQAKKRWNGPKENKTFYDTYARRVPQLHSGRAGNSGGKRRRGFSIYLQEGEYTITKVENPGQSGNSDGAPVD